MKHFSVFHLNNITILQFFYISFYFSWQNLDFGSDKSSSDSCSGDNSDIGEGEFMFDGPNPEEIFKDCEEEDDDDEELSDEELFEKEFTLHKRDYYITKLKYPEMTK